jgi:hypothetical protein
MTIRNFYKSGISTLSNQRNLRSVGSQLQVNYLVIGGGGGGSQAGGSSVSLYAAGGGAGGYRSSFGNSGENTIPLPTLLLPLQGYQVTIGAGGAMNSGVGSPTTFYAITCAGGGNTSTQGNGGAGASGAGAYTFSTTQFQSGGAGLTTQGFRGGNCTGKDNAGGGGGAGAPGGDGNNTGGIGLASSITGTSVIRGYGGSANNGGAGAANTGNGGNGGVSFGTGGGANGGAGGSGVVILRYPAAFTLTIGAGLSGTTTTVQGEKVTTITSGTGTITWS